jgi:hypothetical protein
VAQDKFLHVLIPIAHGQQPQRCERNRDGEVGQAKRSGGDSGNMRNGSRVKTVITDVGPGEITVPRDRDGSFEPKIVRKRQRRLSGVDEMVISLAAKGLTTGEISAHLAEVYGAEVSKRLTTLSCPRRLLISPLALLYYVFSTDGPLLPAADSLQHVPLKMGQDCRGDDRGQPYAADESRDSGGDDQRQIRSQVRGGLAKNSPREVGDLGDHRKPSLFLDSCADFQFRR